MSIRLFSILLTGTVIAAGGTSCGSVSVRHSVPASFITPSSGREAARRHMVLDLPDVVGAVRFLDDDRLLYVNDNELVIQGIRNTMDRKTLKGHTGFISDWDLSPDGKTVVSASSDGTVRFWDARSGAPLAVSEPVDTLSQPSWMILQDVMFSPDGKRVFTGDMDGIRTWSVRDGRLLELSDADFYMRWGLLSPDMKTCAAPMVRDGGFEVMDWGGGSLFCHEGPQSLIGYSPDGRSLLFADDGSGKMYALDIPSLRKRKGYIVLTPFLRDGETTACAAFSPDGKEIVSASEDGTIYVWNADTGALLEAFPSGEDQIAGVFFDRSGNRIAAFRYGSTRIHLWDSRGTGKRG